MAVILRNKVEPNLVCVTNLGLVRVVQLPLGPVDQLGEKHNSNGQAPTNVKEDLEESEDITDTEETDSQRDVTTFSTNDSIAASTGTVTVRKRRRRVQIKTTFVATLNPSNLKNFATKGRKKTPIVKIGELQEALTDGARFTTSYAFDIFKRAIEKMRKPLLWTLVLYMLAWLASRITPTIRTALSPLCIIPGISPSTLCVPVKPPPPVNFEELVQIQDSTFEKLVGETAGSSQSSMRVLRAGMTMRDLSPVVRFSNLKSKDSIADSLDTISADAKRTGRGLSRLDAKVAGAIDEMIALNNYAMVTIQDAHKMAPSPLMQAVSPYKLGLTAEEMITEAFVIAMDQSERVIQKLILETEVSSQHLDQLDADIAVLHEMVTHENKHTKEERETFFSQMWITWGRNKEVLRGYDDHLALLKNLEDYREEAATRVETTLRELHRMSEDLEVLRDRVVAPVLLVNKVPLQVHVDNIQNGLERLQEWRTVSRWQRIAYDETGRIIL